MRKIVIAVTALTLLSACNKPGVQETRSNNANFEVTELFTDRKGCTINRFKDGWQYVYYANCPNQDDVQTSWEQSCGKSCTRPVGVRTE